MSFVHTFDTAVFATSSLPDGNMAMRYGDAEVVKRNRARFLSRIGCTSGSIALMEVSHTDAICHVRGTHMRSGGIELIPSEALHTHDDSVTLALLTADCLPVAYVDSHTGVRALAHLGWRPIALGLATSVVRELVTNYGTRCEDICIAIGPSIRAASYAFSEVEQMQDSTWHPYLTRDATGNIHIDLHARVIDELVNAGIPREGITDCMTDTFVEHDYFSHARARATGEPEGRFLSVLSPVV